MLTSTLGLALAGVASLALNGSYLVQHAALTPLPRVSARRPLRTLRGLLGSPAWRRGAALGYGGLALEVGALALAPLALVQSVVAAGLVVVAVAACRVRRRPLDVREALAAIAMAGALAGLAISPAGGGPSAAPVGRLLALEAMAAAVALGFVQATRGSTDPARLGLAAGVLYGGTTVALATLLGGVRTGDALLVAVAAASGALATVGGFFAFQRGLQSGCPVPVVTLMTAGTNAIAIAGGLLVLGEGLGATPSVRALHLAAFALVPLAAALAAPGLAGEGPPPQAHAEPPIGIGAWPRQSGRDRRS